MASYPVGGFVPLRRGDCGVMTGNGAPWIDEDDVRFMLEECRTWAVVGLSGDPTRTAYGVARFLQDRGKQIVPVHPQAHHVLGEDGYPSLAEIPFEVDVVDVFRRSEAAGEFADQAVGVGAKGVWFQLGVVDQEAFRRTTEAGVPMVMDTCPVMEWPRLNSR
jgi:predicted CoA-binding protein